MQARVPLRAGLAQAGAAWMRAYAGAGATAQAWWPPTRKVDVQGATMAYCDSSGTEEKTEGGPTVLMIHGNPTSSFLWRNVADVIRKDAPQIRCVAPDLVGMGMSGPADVARSGYRLVDHAAYLDAFVERVLPRAEVPKLHIVIHDWGSALGFHWAHRHADRVASISFMEGFTGTLTWDDFPAKGRDIFQAMRTDAGEEIVLRKNVFLEKIFPRSIARALTDEEFDAYKAPFRVPGEGRRPMLTWPRSIPIVGDGPVTSADIGTEDVVHIVEAYNQWLATTADLPKLYLHAEPGFFAPLNERHSRAWPNVTQRNVKGLHFCQEDDPGTIGGAIAEFVCAVHERGVLRSRL